MYDLHVEIEFDQNKNAQNIAKRGLSFSQVADFEFSTAKIAEDLRRTYPERRWQALGVIGTRLHMLVFSPLPGGIRVISLRKANKREVKRYERTSKP